MRIMVFLFALAASAAAQTQPSAPAPSSNQPAAPASISAVVDREVSNYERLLVNAADAMPEDKFNFNPASLNIPGAAYKDVRTFATLLKHTATANYFYWGAVSGEKPPDSIKGPNGPDELKTKAEIIQFLKDSFAAGHRAARMLTTENALEAVQVRNQNGARLYFATNAVIHCADEYGQVVEYLRMNGIVPPASAGR
ncbi:MAG: DinB family protein [Acidobacteria bacterium]|nr:DinB family protein [Acidobacteriota bacterium]